MHRLALVLLTAISLPTVAQAAQASLQITLDANADIQRHTVSYDCAAENPISVTYINAAPNFLALAPVPDETEPLVFASVISASGARYVSGQYVWLNNGTEASLFDETLGEDAEPILTCSEINNTP